MRGRAQVVTGSTVLLLTFGPGTPLPSVITLLPGAFGKVLNAKYGARLLQLAALCTDWRLTLYSGSSWACAAGDMLTSAVGSRLIQMPRPAAARNPVRDCAALHGALSRKEHLLGVETWSSLPLTCVDLGQATNHLLVKFRPCDL